MTRTAPRPLRNPEVVANLWLYADEDGYVARLAGKSYVLEGSDQDKLAMLRHLAAADFLSAEWLPVPKNFGVVSPKGERLQVAQLTQLADEYTKAVLVGPMLEKLAEALPQQLRQRGETYEPFAMRMPEAPLTVLTVVIEYPDGRLVPVLNV